MKSKNNNSKPDSKVKKPDEATIKEAKSILQKFVDAFEWDIFWQEYVIEKRVSKSDFHKLKKFINKL
jgi:hypothetical protein